jgi:hypothetical protein
MKSDKENNLSPILFKIIMNDIIKKVLNRKVLIKNTEWEIKK